jgi:aspartyl protease family protein
LASRRVLRLFVIALVVAGIIGGAAAVSGGGFDSWDSARAVPLVVILVLMVARLAASTRPLGGIGRQMALLLAFGAMLVIGYSYRNEARGLSERLLGSLLPSRGVEVAPGTMRFTADDNGQFAIDATVDGVKVHFLMDTGASGIALSQRDAARLGFDESSLRYSGNFSTANGRVRAAPITLNTLEIGPFSANDVPAWVNGGDLDRSLLGMSYLSTLGRIEIRGDTLILEQMANH